MRVDPQGIGPFFFLGLPLPIAGFKRPPAAGDDSTEEYCREQSNNFGSFSRNGVDGQLWRACRSFVLDLELAT